MAHVVPPRDTWRYALRTVRPYDPAQFLPLASTYDEAQESRDITHPDGVRRPTVFFNSPHGRDRLLREGWEDVTHLWPATVEAPSDPGAEPEARRRRPTVPIRG